MTVTEMRQLGSERYELAFSDGNRVKTTLNVIADCSLYAGRELTQEEYEQVLGASALAGAKARALRIINLRPMSERELFDRLVEKGESEQNAAACVAWLLRLHFLDDGEYARSLVHHYAAKGYGSRRIQNELYRHKVPKALWDGALDTMPESDEKIDRLLRAKLKSDAPDRAELKKATDSLLRRGFSWDEIRAAVARYNADIEEEY